ncbi:drug/metabolite transporter (DMT)-like permease [Friedmanniella endophytica]|uniref:Drug/metabolite transporter (DMT)-like permease n=1 Tax=Microlunatus kandeliicorticis TaxID=1759536 RepID=A0A7W3IS99_9ACTN|nr:DMT family transporter [Microlunatus kandeliicorticis]MBA8794334.1 drug/metabolite transporter (DMT)-like permease [Microlunatus kandeliicorticis]
MSSPVPSPTAPGGQRLALAALLVMTAAWGSTFFMIKDVVTRIPVVDMLAVRFALAAVALLALAAPSFTRLARSPADLRRVLRNGAVLGVLYGAAQLLQTFGLARTDASVSGFITGLYVVLTPVLGALLFRVRLNALTWLAVVLAGVGLGVLSLRGFAIGPGELLTLGSAVLYALHILTLDRLGRHGEETALAAVQMVVIALICGVAAVPGGLRLPASGTDWLIVLYLAVVAGALAMFLQTWAQARVGATRAAVVMAMEPVWAAAFAITLGSDRLSVRIVIGGLAILAAMYLVEIGPALRTRRRTRALATATAAREALDAAPPDREP